MRHVQLWKLFKSVRYAACPAGIDAGGAGSSGGATTRPDKAYLQKMEWVGGIRSKHIPPNAVLCPGAHTFLFRKVRGRR